MKINKNFFKNSLLISGIIAFIIVGINIVSFSFKDEVTDILCGNGINYFTDEGEEARLKGIELASKVESSGITMLKNDNEILPLKENKVNIFGWGGSNSGFIYQGQGSGYGSKYKQTSLAQGLEEEGIKVNETLLQKYEDLGYSRPGYSAELSTSYRLYEPDRNFYTNEVINQAKNFSSTALIVISRIGLEGTDIPLVQYDENGKEISDRKYQSLSSNEEEMINIVTHNFSEVIVILNTSNVFECAFLNNKLIDSCLAIYMPGNNGSIGLAKILNGEETPSGKTVDTWPYELESNASFPTSGTQGAVRFSDIGNNNIFYQDYLEGIYVGYRYYETADQIGYFDEINNIYGKGYNGVVQYPFGYGLSYTDFSWKVSDVSVTNGSGLFFNSESVITIKLQVVNIGNKYSGSDVIEIYYEPPYIKGEIEKSSKNLVAFKKTSVLKPNEGEEVTLSFKARDLASYDCYDKNNDSFMGYQLDKGKYNFYISSDAHTLKKDINQKEMSFYLNLEDAIKYEKDEVTNYKVQNQFTTYKNEISKAYSVINEKAVKKAFSIDGSDLDYKTTYLSRENFEDTMTHLATRREINPQLFYTTYLNFDPINNSDDKMPITSSKKTSYTLSDLLKAPYEDNKWDDLVSQLNVDELALLSAHGGFGTIAINSIKKGISINVDGPSGLNTSAFSSKENVSINYPCEIVLASSWDTELAYEVGLMVGEEAKAVGVDGWYAPGVNIHRSNMGGRNFEYFSEDPFLSGEMCSYEVLGAKEKGLTCFVKHFALNDTDTGRNGEYKFISEQALREIYLRPFEKVVKKGRANALMASVDRIGTTRASSSYALLTEVLRNEWGFKGTVVTDCYQGGFVHNPDESIRAGNDLMFSQDLDKSCFMDLKSATAVKALQKSAKNILYTITNTKYYSAITEGIDFDKVNFTKSEVYPWWIPLVISLDVLIAILLVGSNLYLYFRVRKKNS